MKRDKYSGKESVTLIETKEHKIVFTKLDMGTVRRLEEAFSNSYTYEQAALYAKISASTLHQATKDYPEFKAYLESLRELHAMKAKENIGKALSSGNIAVSQWLLERKEPKNYAPKNNLDVEIKSKVIKSYLPPVDEKIEDGQRIDE